MGESITTHSIYRFLIDNMAPKKPLSLQVATLTFVNILIDSIDKLEDRVKIRQKLITIGIIDSLKKLNHIRVDNMDYSAFALKTQISFFQNFMNDDEKETTLRGLNIGDVDEVYKYLKNIVDEGERKYICDILVPKNKKSSEQIWE